MECDAYREDLLEVLRQKRQKEVDTKQHQEQAEPVEVEDGAFGKIIEVPFPPAASSIPLVGDEGWERVSGGGQGRECGGWGKSHPG
jgi:hypothetical protein